MRALPVIALICAASAAPAWAEQTPRAEVGSYSLVFAGVGAYQEMRVEVVRIGPRANDEFLIKVSGVDHELDQRVFKYKRVQATTGWDYVKGKMTVLTERNATENDAPGTGQLELHLSPLGTFHLAPSSNKNSHPQLLLREFMKSGN